MSVEFNAKCTVGKNEIPVVLYYTEDDPACISFQFFNVTNESSPEWEFGRDLLKEALETGSAGNGDVKIEVQHEEKVLFWLYAPDGEALATFQKEVLDEFMEFVYDEVPEGEDDYEIPDGIPEDWLV